MAEFLSGKHALVTGGGTGIGLAIARALADAGASVTITGRRLDVLREVANASPNIHALEMDVTDEDSVAGAVAAAVAARGPIDICVANAGIAEGRGLAKTDLEFWRRIMTTNLDGAFLTIRECMKSMYELPWGRVIAVASIAGLRGSKGTAAYTASKHGVIGLIRALSVDYMGRGITFNALCPGYVDTPIIEQNVASISGRTGMSAQEARALMVDQNPHGKLITPAEVAAAALWLCAPGSDSVNGQAVEIAGGQV
jgi:NAD(P)-dependent dehydrogenase (short-subunit alcohol dehydrogenase family)